MSSPAPRKPRRKAYAVEFMPAALKELEKLPEDVRRPLFEAIIDLGRDPFPHGSEKLQGGKGHRIRHGVYRAVYQVDRVRLVVVVDHVAHRREVYR